MEKSPADISSDVLSDFFEEGSEDQPQHQWCDRHVDLAHAIADDAAGDHDADIEHVLLQAVGADDAKQERADAHIRIGQIQDARPQADERQIQNEQQDIAKKEASDHGPDKIRALLEEEWPRGEPVDDERAHQHGNRRRAWDAKGQQRNHGGISVGVVGALRCRHAFDGAVPKPFWRLRETLLEGIRHEGRNDRPDTRNKSKEKADAGPGVRMAPIERRHPSREGSNARRGRS
jgi:hypothetical protein